MEEVGGEVNGKQTIITERHRTGKNKRSNRYLIKKT